VLHFALKSSFVWTLNEIKNSGQPEREMGILHRGDDSGYVCSLNNPVLTGYEAYSVTLSPIPMERALGE
jgi:hypothetical protein